MISKSKATKSSETIKVKTWWGAMSAGTLQTRLAKRRKRKSKTACGKKKRLYFPTDDDVQ